MTEVAFLDLADPAFSVRSGDVRKARDANWYARTPYGIAVLRYDEVSALAKDPRLIQGSARWPALNGASGLWARWWLRIMLNREGEDHGRLRRLAMPAFSPKLIEALRPRFQEIANELIDVFAPRGACEFVREFSDPYAARIICLLLGAPMADAEMLAQWSAEMGLALGVNFKRDEPIVDAALTKYFTYVDALIAARRQKPGDDFVTRLVEARDQDDKLDDEELRDMLVLLIQGGIETTRNQLGLAIDTFIAHPEQWRLLAEHPELAGNAVEEVMRTRPTITWFTREATADFVFRDLAIAEGMVLHLISESAGTDPAKYTAPAFDIRERKAQHFGFGGGPHHCIGHYIARSDMGEALKLLARRLPGGAHDGEAVWLPDSGNTGPVRLPIRFALSQEPLSLPRR
jgi:cytochrome P450